MVNATQCVHDLVDALDRVAIPFMVVGSFSSNVYGIPRSTRDADFVVQLGSHTLQSLMSALGGPYRLDPQVAFESVTGTTKHVIRHMQTQFEIELFELSNDPHDRQRFGRRVKGDIEGKLVYLPSPEDVVITKLRWFKRINRSKDIEDVRNVLDVQGASLDIPYVRTWTDIHGTTAILDRLLGGDATK